MKRYEWGFDGMIESKVGKFCNRDDVEDLINEIVKTFVKEDDLQDAVNIASREGFWMDK